ncbi:ABC transporter permease [Mucilaginibacter sp. L3T2-6]|uniref:ABC transporter permease n=1 Tax=Mucilaginibacter sp. L3T2-6 TaxID=3062491 RepID=UPI0026758C98|nr:ABC transporter permease subunit [Mucilaginibacter sp. L3T2-6]MDO3643626.1 ABC transporter permease subunit [Mucilaginibacter sp. L3T2-6]MDV6216126.1 ABC transporter permease subunit [Mucilaginibacter sp. L3T2-6]
MFKIAKYIILDIVRSKVLIAYTVLLLAISLTIFMADGDVTKGLVSITTVIMIIVPLVSVVYSTTYYFNAAEFTELLVSQPISRKNILMGKFIGIGSSVLFAFVAGVCIPVSIFAFSATGITLMVSGCLLTLSFVSLAFFTSTRTRDKARGIGLALMLWFYFAILFDGLVLLFLYSFADYPLEKAMIALTALNPIDLARILILLQLDISALMGYTGALYQQFFGSGSGIIFSLILQIIWIGAPLLLALKAFKKKDL